jgi:hypothetical protein
MTTLKGLNLFHKNLALTLPSPSGREWPNRSAPLCPLPLGEGGYRWSCCFVNIRTAVGGITEP